MANQASDRIAALAITASEGSDASEARAELARRCAATPADAEIRGVFLHAIDEAFAREAEARASMIRLRPRGYAMVTLRSYLEEVHALGTALGPTPALGIERLHAGVAGFLLNHPGAKLFVTARDRDPLVLLGRLERTRSMMASYGEWRVSGTRGDVVVTVRNEWAWIEEMWCSIIASVFPACGLPPGHLETTLDSPFSATVRVRW